MTARNVIRAASVSTTPDTLRSVSVLGYDDQLVEVEGTAVCPARAADGIRLCRGRGSLLQVGVGQIMVGWLGSVLAGLWCRADARTLARCLVR
ncbi:MAG: RidA/YER057c/UK114 superfamily protein [uncultured Corynebacteriales bacterium]|uniref:RidA/YER057c/UK114 superfamily protein n=1 Tax=uncultured Mycobacteriales bacterium TaxID=581187 RepID=A0A6J4JK88_9ACTN|nr:MAG: RidA/YER057c/UK114 superfamily protein [uncultured Corynebacteriales bacterium]